MAKKTIIIAEAGVNHNGDIKLAKALVDAASAAGVDYVKFQTFSAKKLVSGSAKLATYQQSGTEAGSQLEMLKKLELSASDHHHIIQYCAKKEIKFLSTAFDLDSLDYLASLKLDFFKIPSGEITNLPYLEKVASFGKPVVLSTGMANMKEIRDALSVLTTKGITKEDITILHCNTQYPTPMKDVNLLAMNAIGQAFSVQVGYSDHTLGIEVPIAAVALGATVIEKHFTTDRNLEGPDHSASLEGDELKQMVQAIRNIETALTGSGTKSMTSSEVSNKAVVRKSIHLLKSKRQGETIQMSDLTMLRPGDGISPMDLNSVLNNIVVEDLAAGTKVGAKASKEAMRKIAIITGNRAEYGLLRNVIREIHLSETANLFLLVTGAHLSQRHGASISEIEKDEVPVLAKVPILEVEGEMNIAQVMSKAIAGFGDLFRHIEPDIALFLGDRYETFAAVSAAVATHTPIAHCHGGEISEGSIDNQWRHAITKMSNVHFCATEEFRQRIIQMGEQPEKVFNVGALGIENIKSMPLLSIEEIESSLNFQYQRTNAVVTFHAETSLSEATLAQYTKNLLNSLLNFRDLGIILTYPNPDEGHQVIIQELVDFNQQHPDRTVLVKSLGAHRYLSVLNTVDLVIGNSSSGLIEAPSFHIATINIGARQNGRLAPRSVIHAGYEEHAITEAIAKGLSDAFKADISDLVNPYDGGDSSRKIAEILSSISLDNIIFKKFNDLKCL